MKTVHLALVFFGVLLFHILVNKGYGFHRDELYMIDCSNHLAWGFMDMPPLTPFLAKVTFAFSADSTVLFRILPALCHALTVIIGIGIAQKLGGGMLSQSLTAWCVFSSPLYAVAGSQFQTIPVDQVLVAAFLLIFIYIVQSNSHKIWLVCALSCGLAFLNKYTSAVFFLSGFLAIVVSKRFDLVFSMKPVVAVLLFVAIVSPNLIWQIEHNFPVVEHANALRDSIDEDFSLFSFVAEQVFVLSPVNFLIAIVGIVSMFRAKDAGRVVAWLFIFAFAIFLATKAKSYYLSSAYIALMAAGCLWLENHWQRYKRTAVAGIAMSVVLWCVTLPLFLPILPIDTAKKSPIMDLRYDFREQIGWPELAGTVGNVYRKTTANHPDSVLIIAANYGEAGAINLFGKQHGIPSSACTMPTNASWGYTPKSPRVFVFVGYQPDYLRKFFADVQVATVIDNAYQIDNEERGQSITICQSPVKPFEHIWAELRHW